MERAGSSRGLIVNGQTGYLQQSALRELPGIQPLDLYIVYNRQEQPLLALPLTGADRLATLRSGQMLTVTGHAKGYYKVRYRDVAGYVGKSTVSLMEQLPVEAALVLTRQEEALFIDSTGNMSSDKVLMPGQLYKVIGQENGYFKLAPDGLYIQAEVVETVLLNPLRTPMTGFVNEKVPLHLLPGSEPMEGQLLEPGRLYTFTAGSGSWLYLDEEGLCGFADPTALHTLPKRPATMNRTWAVQTGMGYLPGSHPLPPDDGAVIQLKEMYGDDWFKAMDGRMIHRGALRIIGSDAPVETHTVTATEDIILLSLPDSTLGEEVATIPAGDIVTVTGFSRHYLLVSYNGQEGYAVGAPLLTDETKYLPSSEDDGAYMVHVNKATLTVSVYRLDAAGKPAGAPLMQAVAALGKRSTPTPSGTFYLGTKYRWVRFTYSQTPHSICYRPGRYIHGLPCYTSDIAAKVFRTERELGTFSSGGCVRMPFDIAEYIYFTCPSYTTKMEVTSGELPT
jgi:hypothetical protein